MTRVTVLTSCYGNYDQVAAPPAQRLTDDVDYLDWVLVTDRYTQVEPWRTIVEPRPQLHPRLAAKVAKCRPDRYTNADVTIWVDTSFQITSPDFVTWCIEHLGHAPIAQLPHPVRTSIVDEAAASEAHGKYVGLPLREQVAHYLAGGYPEHWGLWATGLIVRRRTSEMCDIGNAWLTEQTRWTYQDQLSEPVLLHAAGVRPVDLPGQLWGHDMFTIRAHASSL